MRPWHSSPRSVDPDRRPTAQRYAPHAKGAAHKKTKKTIAAIGSPFGTIATAAKPADAGLFLRVHRVVRRGRDSVPSICGRPILD